MTSRDGLCSPMEEFIPSMVKLQLVGVLSPAHPMKDYLSCLAGSLPPRHILRLQAKLHTNNNTAEISSVVDYLFLDPLAQSPVIHKLAFFYDSKLAANICMGMILSRTNVPFGMTSQRLLLQVQLRLRLTLQHFHSHGQNVGNESADHAAALGSFVSSRTRTFVLVGHSSFDSLTLFEACRNQDEAIEVLRNARMTHALAPQVRVRR